MDFSLQGNLKPICPDHMLMWIGSDSLHLFMYFITFPYSYYIKSETPWNCKWYETDFEIHYSGPFHKVSSCCCNARRHLNDNTYAVLHKSNKVTLQKGHIYKATSRASKTFHSREMLYLQFTHLCADACFSLTNKSYSLHE